MTSVGQRGPTKSQQRQWAIGLIIAVMAIGTTGYLILGLSFADAIYQTGITVTTVGFGEVTDGGEPTAAYRWFTLVLVLIGASAAVFAAGVMIETMVDQRAGVFRERQMQRKISAMQDHVIICGFGRVGRAVAHRATGLGGEFVVIDQSAEVLADCPHPNIVGDATLDAVLRMAGVEKASALIACLSTDASNLFLAVSAQQINPAIQIVTRANESANADKLRAMNFHTVVDPYEMAGARLATAALRPHTSEYLDQVFSTESDQVELTEVDITAGSKLVGLTVPQTEAEHGVVVVAHHPSTSERFSSPRSFVGTLDAGDVIIVLGDRESINDLES